MEKPKPEYRLTPKARDDMEAIWLYSLGGFGLQQAERYIDDITAAYTILSENPKVGKACENIRTGYRKYPVTHHVVYYRVTNYGIEVIRILHERMMPERHF